MLAEAATACLDDTPVDPDTVDHLYVANAASGELEGQTDAMNALAQVVECYWQLLGEAGDRQVEDLRDPAESLRSEESQSWVGYRFDPV